MLDTRTFELINADLDRELGPDEAAERIISAAAFSNELPICVCK